MTDDLERRIDRLESIVADQQEIIEAQQETIADLRDERGKPEPTLTRRSALTAGGLLVLSGVAGGTASADAQGQVGTASDPLSVLYTQALDSASGGLTDAGSGPEQVTTLAGPGLSIAAGALGLPTTGNAGDILRWDGSAWTLTPEAGGHSVSDDGTQVLAGVDDVNFGARLSVIDDGDGTVTIFGTPTITAFAMTNPSGGTLELTIEVVGSLANIAVEITDSSGAVVTTLTEGDFSETCSASTCTYTGTAAIAKSDTYTATVTTATDAGGLDSPTGQSDTATITAGTPRVAYVVDGGTLQTLDAAGIRTDYAPGDGDLSTIGPPADLTGDGTIDIPYVDTNSNLQLAEGDGTTQTLDSDTVYDFRIGIGDWDEDGTTEVVYSGNKGGNQRLHSVAVGETPTEFNAFGDSSNKVADVASGANFDGTGGQDVVWVEGDFSLAFGSLYYSEDLSTGGTQIKSTPPDRSISTPADFDNDGTVEVALFARDIELVESDGTTTTLNTNNASDSPMAALDYTGTSTPDLLHRNDDTGELYYYDVDNTTTGAVTDYAGNTITIDDVAGVV